MLDYRIIATIGIFIYLVLVLQRKKALKNFPFERHLADDLKKRGLTYLSAEKCEDFPLGAEKIPLISSIMKKDIGMKLFSGSFYSGSDKLYFIFKVEFTDKNAQAHKTLAAVEYAGFSKIRVKGISWHPSINFSDGQKEEKFNSLIS